ncbi:MAG: lamin tail domain-containing protein, partial [Chloroflexi bacterium]|nr:lamin tail domain-containing protein [Chloroflexota bacterium]
DAEGGEFVEISNHGDIFQDMSGWRLTGGIEFRFPAGFRIEAGGIVVIAANPAALAGLTGSAPLLGPWTGNLDNAGEVLELRDSQDAIRLRLQYLPDDPWPVAADGTGHSLILVSPSYGEDDPRAWAASWQRGGSPGRRDPLSAAPVEAVVINEFLAHTDLPDLDFVEIFNRSTTPVDVSRWILTDNIETNRYRVPAETVLAPGAALAFDENVLGFRLNAAGETIHLLNADGSRVVDVVRFRGQENGVATGRHPNGAATFRRLAAPTPGGANAPRRTEDVVINEIFYNPPFGDEDEFVELHHRGNAPIDLAGWRMRGGVAFDFPAGTALQAGQFLVIARDQVRLRSNHPTLAASSVFGNYAGTLNNSGDVVRLDMPYEIRTTNQQGVITIDAIHITVGEVRFAEGGAWGRWSDGGGSSLELIDPDADPALAGSWADSDESSKSAWSTVEWTGNLDNGVRGTGVNRLYLGLLNDGECLVDNIEVLLGASANFLQNPGFESGPAGWFLGGNHARSTIDATGARSGGMGLRIKAQGGLDTGINSIRGVLGNGLAAGKTVTLRASVRWITGWPELLFRFRGNYADYAAPLQVPGNLGTPGRANSRRVANAGPAIYDVTHFPALPRDNDAVQVTARVSDPDSVTQFVLRYRVDPSTTREDIPMRDDGLEGDVLAGDGLFTATIPARASGLIAFTLAAADGLGASSAWPREAPLDEGLIRWADPLPFGTFPHVHLWATSTNRDAPGGNALNNAQRHCTIVYGNNRVIYGCLFRDKGSPYSIGAGDIVAWTPEDEKLHGVSERLFSKTGQGMRKPAFGDASPPGSLPKWGSLP